MKSVSIPFETLVARVGFELAACICDKELDEDFWLGLTPEQKASLLETALGDQFTPRWGFRPDDGIESSTVGSIVIHRFATTFDEWFTTYERLSRTETGNEALIKEAVAKLKDLAVSFSDWAKIHDSCEELRTLALSHLDKLAQTREEHCKVIAAGSEKTMKKVAAAVEKKRVEGGGRTIQPPEVCDIAKEIEPVTELEKRHWRAVVETNPSWSEVRHLMYEAGGSDHPLSCKASRMGDAQGRDKRLANGPVLEK